MRLEDQKTAKKLRRQGWTLPEIAKEVSAGKGLVSLWVRDVQISKAGKLRLAERKDKNLKTLFDGRTRVERARSAWSLQRKAAREGFREEGRVAASKNERLHILACALYWGEGSKTRCAVDITNSDINVLRVFLDFCRVYFDVKPHQMAISISAYTHVHTKEEIIAYWIKGLKIKGVRQKTHFFDDYRFSSKGVSTKKIGKLPYGTINLYIDKSSRMIQHIYGALEVYGGTIIDPKR